MEGTLLVITITVLVLVEDFLTCDVVVVINFPAASQTHFKNRFEQTYVSLGFVIFQVMLQLSRNSTGIYIVCYNCQSR
jgi:hypothetical protein